MKRIIHSLRSLRRSLSPIDPLIAVRISKEALFHNWQAYTSRYPQILFAPVLKSNAYGHGLIEIAKLLDEEQKAFLVVDSLFEAQTLRHHGIRSKVLIIGYTTAENIASSTIDASFVLTSLDQLKEIDKQLKKPKIFHLKIDTGMHRQGIMPNELGKAFEIIQANRHIKLEGICSHFADADTDDSPLTQQQTTQWNRLVTQCKAQFPSVHYFHMAATAGIHHLSEIDCNVARLGIGLYGISPLAESSLDLRPILSMQTVISSIRTVKDGDPIGYNGTYTATADMRIATIPVGYYEGLDRRLGNKGTVLVKNKPCPIVGRISMNISSIDISAVSDVSLNTPVTVISADTNQRNSVVKMAELANTIPHEILVHVPAHLRREVIDTF